MEHLRCSSCHALPCPPHHLRHPPASIHYYAWSLSTVPYPPTARATHHARRYGALYTPIRGVGRVVHDNEVLCNFSSNVGGFSTELQAPYRRLEGDLQAGISGLDSRTKDPRTKYSHEVWTGCKVSDWRKCASNRPATNQYGWTHWSRRYSECSMPFDAVMYLPTVSKTISRVSKVSLSLELCTMEVT